ncbi:MAG TPA: hypothetical protein VKR31_05430 [Rhizomicrobium sp.]|nr:hypothetical protein [Rhizomicrobium sp.]
MSMLASTTLQIADAVRSDTVQPAPSAVPPVSAPPPAVAVRRPIDLSLPVRIHHPANGLPGTEFSSPSSDAAQTNSAYPGFSLGPLRTEFGGTTGRHMHLATVKLEGVSVFGGSVGGSVDSRSARVTLSWPTGN